MEDKTDITASVKLLGRDGTLDLFNDEIMERVVYSLVCDQCAVMHSYDDEDLVTASNVGFYDAGWRARENEVLCPDCAR